MDFLSSILALAPCLCDYASKQAVYIADLEQNLESLREATTELQDLREDVKRRVELAEHQHMIRRREVDGWLHRVEELEEEVKEILQKGNREVNKQCFRSCCPQNCRSSYQLGKRAIKRLDDVIEQKNKGRFEVVADGPPLAPVDELPLEKTVGLDSMHEKVLECLKEEQMTTIGLYGTAGVGKTTLLKKINNDFLARSHDFDVVIWVVVSKSGTVQKVQEVIRNKLRISNETWSSRSSTTEKAAELWKILKTKRFVLLLDDLWERIDLLEVGIPLQENGKKCKVIFTTRSEDVCIQMKAQRKIRVECLKTEEAFALFREEVGEMTLNSHPDILELARLVADECKGLPLALMTVGRALASVKTLSGWEQAVRQLRHFPAKISGVENELFHKLKFSYDSLGEEVFKTCFIYCSLFPEDYEINNDTLVELWIGEGFLQEVSDIYEARGKGYEIIQKLKLACLLESVESKGYCIKMHDVIRDMALWIASEYGARKNKILVYEYAGLIESEGVSKWKDAERVSLWNRSFNDIEELNETPSCPNLLTLLVQSDHPGMCKFPRGFFQFMPVIKVLNLSGAASIRELPMEFYKLVNLEYLNLSETSISELLSELKSMTKLRCLLLDYMVELKKIPPQVISRLSSLQWFSMYGVLCSSEIVECILEELEQLESMNDISFNLSSALAVNKLSSSHKLQRWIKRLHLNACQDLVILELSSSSLRRMSHLKRFFIEDCPQLEHIKVRKEVMQGHSSDYNPNLNFIIRWDLYFQKLHEVIIWRCPKLLNLTWRIYVPRLRYIYIESCESMEEVIGDASEVKESLEIFSNLNYLALLDLPRLKSICSRPLQFPSLERINVSDCMMLRRLPFDSNTQTSRLKAIEGNQKWWDDLQWEDETIKGKFTKYFPSRRRSDWTTEV